VAVPSLRSWIHSRASTVIAIRRPSPQRIVSLPRNGPLRSEGFRSAQRRPIPRDASIVDTRPGAVRVSQSGM